MRQLLEAHHLDYYETHAGMWGVGTSAIWLTDDTTVERARELLDAYQQARYERVHGEYQQRVAAGEQETFWQRFLMHPFRTMIYLAIVAVILWFTVMPFILW